MVLIEFENALEIQSLEYIPEDETSYAPVYYDETVYFDNVDETLELPDHFDANADRVCDLYEQCVALMPDRMAVYAERRDEVVRVFLNEADGYEMGGSAVYGGSTFASDIDIRWNGTSFNAFIAEVCAFSDAHGMVMAIPGKNLIKLVGPDVNVDILIVPDVGLLLPTITDRECTETMQHLITHLRLNHTNPRKRVVEFSAVKTAMFMRCYDRVMNDAKWRSVAVFIKTADPSLPTCAIMMMVALAAETIRPNEVHMGWRMAMEIVAQFVWMFVRKLDNENHLLFSFKSDVWAPFCRKYLDALRIPGATTDPVESLFNVDQKEKMYTSHFFNCILTMMWYPLTEVPVSLYPPRSFVEMIPYMMTEFIYLVGLNWHDDKEAEMRNACGYVDGILDLMGQYREVEEEDNVLVQYLWCDVRLSEEVCDVLVAQLQ